MCRKSQGPEEERLPSGKNVPESGWWTQPTDGHVLQGRPTALQMANRLSEHPECRVCHTIYIAAEPGVHVGTSAVSQSRAPGVGEVNSDDGRSIPPCRSLHAPERTNGSARVSALSFFCPSSC
jgi:hypothetical protein